MIPAHNFAFFGTPDVAAQTLTTLLDAGFVPAVVVTSPDAARGRGLAITPSPVKALALEKHLPVLTPETLDDETCSAIGAYGCDYAVVVAFGKIFPEALIHTFPKGALNVHYSLLPKYRGATPLEGALLAGETVTGVTVQRLVRQLDAGDILAHEELPIGPADTARELRPKLIELGAALLIKTLPRFEQGELTPVPQDHAQATQTHKLKKDDGLLALDAPGETNWRKYRAYADTIGVHFFEHGKRMKVTQASFNNGVFSIERVIPEGKTEMAYVRT